MSITKLLSSAQQRERQRQAAGTHFSRGWAPAAERLGGRRWELPTSRSHRHAAPGAWYGAACVWEDACLQLLFPFLHICIDCLMLCKVLALLVSRARLITWKNVLARLPGCLPWSRQWGTRGWPTTHRKLWLSQQEFSRHQMCPTALAEVKCYQLTTEVEQHTVEMEVKRMYVPECLPEMQKQLWIPQMVYTYIPLCINIYNWRKIRKLFIFSSNYYIRRHQHR